MTGHTILNITHSTHKKFVVLGNEKLTDAVYISFYIFMGNDKTYFTA